LQAKPKPNRIQQTSDAHKSGVRRYKLKGAAAARKVYAALRTPELYEWDALKLSVKALDNSHPISSKATDWLDTKLFVQM
jgi:hypothetical protein